VMPISHRIVQGREADIVKCIQIGTPFDEASRPGDITFRRGPMQPLRFEPVGSDFHAV
jgi:hypothetical protein